MHTAAVKTDSSLITDQFHYYSLKHMRDILHGVIFLILTSVSYYSWRRYRSTDYYWFTVIGTISLLISVWDYMNHTVLHLPAEIRFLVGASLMVLDAVLVLLVLKILF